MKRNKERIDIKEETGRLSSLGRNISDGTFVGIERTQKEGNRINESFSIVTTLAEERT